MPDVIGPFRGEYRFLSNFAPVIVELDGHCYPSVEHAYQAAKSTSYRVRMNIRRAKTPSLAKRLGRLVRLRDNWDEIKLGIMRDLVTQKFRDSFYAKQLIATGTTPIMEINNWGDDFWGVSSEGGPGENHLGRILMDIRRGLIEELETGE